MPFGQEGCPGVEAEWLKSLPEGKLDAALVQKFAPPHWTNWSVDYAKALNHRDLGILVCEVIQEEALYVEGVRGRLIMPCPTPPRHKAAPSFLPIFELKTELLFHHKR